MLTRSIAILRQARLVAENPETLKDIDLAIALLTGVEAVGDNLTEAEREWLRSAIEEEARP
ncbi:hypothetical protein MTsN4n12_01550 [Microbacterium sp. MTN4-12]